MRAPGPLWMMAGRLAMMLRRFFLSAVPVPVLVAVPVPARGCPACCHLAVERCPFALIESMDVLSSPESDPKCNGAESRTD